MNKLLSGRRILVIEDEALLLMTLEDMMVDLGCESVTPASTVDTAVRLINGQLFDAAVLDMNLNGRSSRPVADALAARGIPFFVSTGNAGDLGLEFRDHAVLRKPYREDELVEVFRQLLPH